MKYINSIYTPGISGKQGGVVFSSNQYGPYSCQRKIPSNPDSVSQQNVRSSTAYIAREWAKLTPAERKDWAGKASLFPFQKKDKTYFLPAFYFFMKLNRNLYEAEMPLLRKLPGLNTLQPQTFSSFSVSIVSNASGTDILLYFKPQISKKTKICLFATKSQKPTLSYGSSRTYKFAVLDSTFVSGSSIKDLYMEKFKYMPDAASKVYFKLKSVNINCGFAAIPISCETYGI